MLNLAVLSFSQIELEGDTEMKNTTMMLTKKTEIIDALKEAETTNRNLYFKPEIVSVWLRIIRVRTRNNRSTGTSYAVVETIGGSKYSITPELGFPNGGLFDIR